MTCTITGCDRPVLVKTKGWCSRHYQRWQRHGSPTAGQRARPGGTAQERFLAQVEWAGDHLLWTGPVNGKYGRFDAEDGKIYAHRFSWEQKYGKIPNGGILDHEQGCPKTCVLPEHLNLTDRAGHALI